MQRPTYTITQCSQLFGVNAKTLHKWLEREHMEAQRSRADTRIRYLTQEQVDYLVKTYNLALAEPGERLTPAAEPAMRVPATSGITLLSEQLRTQELRLEELEREIRALQSRLQELELQRDQVTQVPANAPIVSPDPPASAQEEGPPRSLGTRAAGKQRSKKKQTRGKRLPKGLVLLRTFAEQHHVPMSRAATATSNGKVAVVRGKWLVNSRWATEALDARGQRDFYQAFHQRDGFEACEACPHISREGLP